MSTVRRVTKNTVLLNAARIVSTLGKFFLFIYVARILGQETLGQFSFAVVFTSFFAIIITLGMDDLLVREVARDNALTEKYLGNMFVMRLLLSLLIFCAIVIAINLMDYPQDIKAVVYIFGGYIVFTSFSFLFRANFRSFEKMEWDALLEILEALFTTIAGLILIFSGYGLVPLSITFLVSAIISSILGFIINRSGFARLKPGIDFKFWKDTIMKSAPFSVFALFLLYPQVDTILLSNLKGDAAVGKYNAAYYIVTAFSPIVMNFMIALVPLISRYFISAKNMLGFVYEKSVKYLLIIAFPISVGAVVLANRLIGLLYGTGYEDSIAALQILGWNCVLLALSRPIIYVLGAINRQGTCAIITLSALTLSISLNLILIPRFSYFGSAGITLLNGCLVILAGWYATKKNGFPLPIIKLAWRPLLASLIMGAVIYPVSLMSGTSLPLLIIIGFFVYLVSIIVLRGIGKDDIALVKDALHIRNRNENIEPSHNSNKELTEIKN